MGASSVVPPTWCVFMALLNDSVGDVWLRNLKAFTCNRHHLLFPHIAMSCTAFPSPPHSSLAAMLDIVVIKT